MNDELQQFLVDIQVPSQVGQGWSAEIGQALLSHSPHMRGPNFKALCAKDLRFVFDAYDDRFFAGRARAALGAQPLAFQISKRMTSNGARTTRFGSLQAGTRGTARFEIAVSSTLLYDTFRVAGETAVVNGLECQNRLDALLRLMEHEIVHLLEMLAWGDSSCKRRRFRNIAEGAFGHLEHAHRLQTRRERAQREFGIRAGMRVTFLDGSHRRTGIVNRITKRATVLVPDPRGARYSDGQRYVKYYVPLPLLFPAS